jgi:hypothetical protein
VQVLPPGENKTQKIAVGDLSGVVQCFCIKKGEVALTFKTLPAPQKASESCKLCCKHDGLRLQAVPTAIGCSQTMLACSSLPAAAAAAHLKEKQHPVLLDSCTTATAAVAYACLAICKHSVQ